MTVNLSAFFYLGGAMALIGSSVCFGKAVTDSMPLSLASAIRYAISLLCLLPLFWRERRDLPTLRKKDWLILILQGLTGQFLFSLFLLYGLRHLSASESGILTSTMPAVIAVLSFLFLKENISRQKATAIASVVAGIVLMNYFGAAQLDQRGANPLLGSILVFGAVIGESLFTIFSKVLTARLRPITIATVVTFFGFLPFLPFAAYEALTFDFTALSWKVWVALFLYGSLITVAPFYLYCRGLALASAGTAAVFTGVMPVSSVICAYLFLGEPFLWFHLLGMGGVLLGIACIAGESPSVDASEAASSQGMKSPLPLANENRSETSS
ncbi:EamA family transporter [Heliobacterium gestii]|uniref:EamA family transporter n=1 Tax=Heliomicrobium gestii TaxID=2699 RepID=A0A845LCY5_HELGE|nr:DMT family transporter [Heliomicrobium gestii]MBM7867166.1 drug/metabolite transporter (DMT)-like permease [Heliomicrobium gestii]MZP43421.1 EamA family transporter [Heliomicrobium gestii]